MIPWERHGAIVEALRSGWIKKLLVGAAGVAAIGWVFRHDDTRARIRETRAAITEVERAAARFRADHERCPRGLRELTQPPGGGVPYMRKIPRDGWGRAFDLVCPGRRSADVVDVRSRGPDGTWFGMDEID